MSLSGPSRWKELPPVQLKSELATVHSSQEWLSASYGDRRSRNITRERISQHDIRGRELRRLCGTFHRRILVLRSVIPTFLVAMSTSRSHEHRRISWTRLLRSRP